MTTLSRHRSAAGHRPRIGGGGFKITQAGNAVLKRLMDWQPETQYRKVVLGRTVGKRGRALALVVGSYSADVWTAVALETIVPGLEAGLQQVFDDHAHKIIGEYPTQKKAMEACESFARAWQKGRKAASFKLCECDDLPIGERPAIGSTGKPLDPSKYDDPDT